MPPFFTPGIFLGGVLKVLNGWFLYGLPLRGYPDVVWGSHEGAIQNLAEREDINGYCS